MSVVATDGCVSFDRRERVRFRPALSVMDRHCSNDLIPGQSLRGTPCRPAEVDEVGAALPAPVVTSEDGVKNGREDDDEIATGGY